MATKKKTSATKTAATKKTGTTAAKTPTKKTPAAKTGTAAAKKAPTKKPVVTKPAEADAKPVDAKPEAKPAEAKKRKRTGMSAIDAAAKVLSESGAPMNCQAMIDAMATKGYWTSPGGKTPAATLYAAITRELNVKGADSRFMKVDRGQFQIASK